jgi:hypothetical protein
MKDWAENSWRGGRLAKGRVIDAVGESDSLVKFKRPIWVYRDLEWFQVSERLSSACSSTEAQ